MIFVYSTFPNEECAEKISTGLLKDKLVACANILPTMNSLYIWEEEIKKDKEVVVIFKTQDIHFEKIEQYIKNNHPYDTPCVLQININKTSKEFLSWVQEVTKTQF